jgi:hypothetical protein
MAAALADLCRYELNFLSQKRRSQLYAVEKRLRQGQVSPAELLLFEQWWYSSDWRGKRGEPPHPVQVLDEWGRFKNRNRERRNDGSLRQPAGSGYRFARPEDFGLAPA